MFKLNYVNNKRPVFKKSINDKKRPAFIRYAMKRANETDVARNELNYTIIPINTKTGQPIKRFRRLNEHRARAMRAMVQAMLYNFNIASNLVMASVEQLSDSCGLSTISKAGNKSITRASRLITDFMEPMGFIKCVKIWDPLLGSYIPKMISLNPLFFMLFGITSESLNKAKNAQLNWINNNLLNKGLSPTNFKKIKKNAKKEHIKRALKHRNYKYHINNQHKKANKITHLPEKDARLYILNSIVKRYNSHELNKMGPVELRNKVNIEYCQLRNIVINTKW
ncbi:plasmid replication initiator RepA (plasmid) [Buchnera aphidicola (Mollitrichosiphum nigrofasciatum)]|uniref:plasmid replication initiator RepA n=1 Tax=Buchnera aphidicola TaxID=9 RepID=UPI0031B8603B